MQEPIKYLVVSIKDTTHISLVRPLAKTPQCCSPEDVFNACTQAVNKYFLEKVKTKDGQQPFLTTDEINRLYSATFPIITAFCNDKDLDFYLIAHRFHDVYAVPHHLTFYLQKIEAVNPYAPKNH